MTSCNQKTQMLKPVCLVMFGTIDIFCNGNPRVASNKRETITIKLTEFKAAAIRSLNEKN